VTGAGSRRYSVTRADYRNTFASAHGRRVLAHMLVDGHFFDEVTDPGEIERRNGMVRVLRNLGAIDPKMIQRFVDTLLDQLVHLREETTNAESADRREQD